MRIGDKEKTKTVDLKKSTNKGTSKNVTASSKLSKSNTMKKETKTDAEAEAKAPNVEQEKKSKELEAKRRRAENLMKQGFKPPIYSEDEKKDWKGKYEDYYAFVSEMIR